MWKLLGIAGLSACGRIGFDQLGDATGGTPTDGMPVAITCDGTTTRVGSAPADPIGMSAFGGNERLVVGWAEMAAGFKFDVLVVGFVDGVPAVEAGPTTMANGLYSGAALTVANAHVIVAATANLTFSTDVKVRDLALANEEPAQTYSLTADSLHSITTVPGTTQLVAIGVGGGFMRQTQRMEWNGISTGPLVSAGITNSTAQRVTAFASGTLLVTDVTMNACNVTKLDIDQQVASGPTRMSSATCSSIAAVTAGADPGFGVAWTETTALRADTGLGSFQIATGAPKRASITYTRDGYWVVWLEGQAANAALVVDQQVVTTIPNFAASVDALDVVTVGGTAIATWQQVSPSGTFVRALCK